MPIKLEILLQQIKECHKFGKTCFADSDTAIKTGAFTDYHRRKDELFKLLAESPYID